MQFLILGMLLLAPMSLYDVHKQFAGGASLFYSASFGSIQRALARLAADGFVVVHEEARSARRRKVHVPTEAGIAAWRAWMLSPPEGADVERVMLARVYLLGLLPDDADRREVIDVLIRNVTASIADLEAVDAGLRTQEVPPEYAEIFRHQRATLDYGLRSHRLALAWLSDLR
ncbi:PadR family transcriptional regulator [Microbacterium xanthum]|uniref:PadR family transcriptional regulator n=1 Tax=Microbacterium xanthum TaxID=3079794 RepID=UPI002AD56068|nr:MULTISPECIES: PadR family transcriptional regulator [unclassified Microbacterium]MDZ8172598.1 PadR family transcriptional regulator [Microbacterium sp. KSW-48]MDZ8202565.1 PadR family transcriptional regulator [Microbacterium sp. SSW1-59]